MIALNVPPDTAPACAGVAKAPLLFMMAEDDVVGDAEDVGGGAAEVVGGGAAEVVGGGAAEVVAGGAVVVVVEEDDPQPLKITEPKTSTVRIIKNNLFNPFPPLINDGRFLKVTSCLSSWIENKFLCQSALSIRAVSIKDNFRFE